MKQGRENMGEVETWEGYDIEYQKRLDEIIKIEDRTKEERDRLYEWAVETTDYLRKSIGSRESF